MKTTVKKATFADAKNAGACYSDDELKAVFGKSKAFTPKQVLALKIPDADKVWALTRNFWLSQTNAVKFAVFCAERCVDIFEARYPNDDRPRKAIEVAKAWVANPTAENKNAATSAAVAANAATNVADAATHAAYAATRAAATYAADAATHAAYAATRAAAYAANAAANVADAATHAAATNAYAAYAYAAANVADAATNAAYAATRAAATYAAATYAADNAERKDQLKYLAKLHGVKIK